MNKTIQSKIGELRSQAYYDSIMPGMTIEQALYIQRQPYGSFPHEVQNKAIAILDSVQRKINEK